MILEGDPDSKGLEYLVFEDGTHLRKASFPLPNPEIQELILTGLENERSGLIPFESDQVKESFLHRVDPPRQLILVGGVHIAIPLAALADTLGVEVTVIDPRRLFGTTDRFPAVKRLLQEWPQAAFQKIKLNDSTAVVMLTHDPKIDDPALKIVLESVVFYIGALGSRKTHEKRQERLRAQGVDQGSLARIHGPVGLNLGASSPEEIALAIMAEIIQVWHQRN
jgi:xanthine dehydrogenase accessory factor